MPFNQLWIAGDLPVTAIFQLLITAVSICWIAAVWFSVSCCEWVCCECHGCGSVFCESRGRGWVCCESHGSPSWLVLFYSSGFGYEYPLLLEIVTLTAMNFQFVDMVVSLTTIPSLSLMLNNLVNSLVEYLVNQGYWVAWQTWLNNSLVNHIFLC